jgi:hypothetical protein
LWIGIEPPFRSRLPSGTRNLHSAFFGKFLRASLAAHAGEYAGGFVFVHNGLGETSVIRVLADHCKGVLPYNPAAASADVKISPPAPDGRLHLVSLFVAREETVARWCVPANTAPRVAFVLIIADIFCFVLHTSNDKC